MEGGVGGNGGGGGGGGGDGLMGGGGGGGGFRGNINNTIIRSNSNIDMLMLPPPPPSHPHPHHQHLMASSSSSSPPSNAEMINALFLPLSSSSSPSPNQNNYQNHKNIHHNNNNPNNNNTSTNTTTTHHLMMFDNTDINNNNNKNTSGSAAAGCYFMKNNNACSFRDKIMAHPHYPRLLAAYINCQKVGAPPEVVDRLEKVMRTSQEATTAALGNGGVGGAARGCIGEDPALDQFMEAYCEMLTKYEQELTKPFKEAMLFFSTIESQLKGLSIAASSSDSAGQHGSSEEEFEANDDFIDPRAEDRELKIKLLRKYSGYLGSLKQEFMKKRKKGKLPKEARQQLLDWWSRHYKWPYPSESQKLALAESTGLDQKQINNWFINQRKRHWKPSEEMQFMVMDHSLHPQYYIDNVMANPFPLDYCAPSSMM